MINVMNFYHGGNMLDVLPEILKTAQTEGKAVYFPGGTYHFYLPNCTGKPYFFCNNDESVKDIAIFLDELDDFTLKGGNALFLFHGRISPLVARRCRNLRIEGIRIDFEESFVSDANLIRREQGIAWFELPGKHWLENGRLRFCDDVYDNDNGMLTFFGYDRKKNECLYNRASVSIINGGFLEKDGLIGIPDRFGDFPASEFIFRHERRLCPGMVFDMCDGVTLENVTIHHSAGMGVLCQNSADVALKKVRVVPSSRRVAASDDAVHMVECRGKLSIEECELTSTLDDSINVHGIYRILKTRTPGGFFYYLDTGHFQQLGIAGARDGDSLELIKPDTHIPYHIAKIKRAVQLNKAMTRVEFEEPLPEMFSPGDGARVWETAQAELTVKNCILRPLRGRGILVSGVKSAVISNCRIHSSGAGIFVSGGLDFWYETGPVGELRIENNIFDNCNYSHYTATRDALTVFPELSAMPEGFFYHGTISVENNIFISAERPLISMKSVAEVICRGNVLQKDDTYKTVLPSVQGYYFAIPEGGLAGFEHCGKTDISDIEIREYK